MVYRETILGKVMFKLEESGVLLRSCVNHWPTYWCYITSICMSVLALVKIYIEPMNLSSWPIHLNVYCPFVLHCNYLNNLIVYPVHFIVAFGLVSVQLGDKLTESLKVISLSTLIAV